MKLIKHIFMSIALVCAILFVIGVLISYGLAFKMLFESIKYAFTNTKDTSVYIVITICVIYIGLISGGIYKGLETIKKNEKQETT